MLSPEQSPSRRPEDVVTARSLPTTEDAECLLDYCNRLVNSGAAVSSGTTTSQSGHPAAEATTAAQAGSGAGSDDAPVPVTMIPVSEVELTHDTMQTQQMLDLLRSTTLSVLSDLATLATFYAPPETVSGTNPHTAVDHPRMFFGDRKKKETLLRVCASSSRNIQSLEELQGFFHIAPQVDGSSPAGVKCFFTFLDAAAAVLHWSQSTLAVVPSAQYGSTTSASAIPLTVPEAVAAADDLENQNEPASSLGEAETPSTTPNLNLNASEGYPAAGGVLRGGGMMVHGTTAGDRIHDVSDNFLKLQARSERFLLPNAYRLDERSGLRLLHPSHFDGLRQLVQDIDAEAKRLRAIEEIFKSATATTPRQDATAQGEGGDVGTVASTMFYPRIGEFEYLRDSLRMILSMAVTEDEVNTLKTFRTMFDAQHDEFSIIQVELEDTCGVSLTSVVLPTNRNAGVPDRQLPSLDLLQRFDATRRKQNEVRKSFLSLLQRKKKTIEKFSPQRTRKPAGGEGWSSSLRSVAAFFRCTPELPQEYASNSTRNSSAGSPPEVGAEDLFLEDSYQLLRCMDDLHANTEALAVLLEHRYPQLYSAKGSWAQMVVAAGGAVKDRLGALTKILSRKVITA